LRQQGRRTSALARLGSIGGRRGVRNAKDFARQKIAEMNLNREEDLREDPEGNEAQ